MTQEEHEALDAMVAEQVMGWREVRQDAPAPRGMEWAGCPPEPDTGDEVAFRRRIPFFSVSIAAAWQIVERLRAEGWTGVDVQAWHPNRNVCKILLGPDEGWRVLEASAPTVPESICRAALAWAERGAGE